MTRKQMSAETDDVLRPRGYEVAVVPGARPFWRRVYVGKDPNPDDVGSPAWHGRQRKPKTERTDAG